MADRRTSAHAEPLDEGPGCGHEMCLFERDCLVVQAEVELDDFRADRARRRALCAEMAIGMGLGTREGRLLEVIAYSFDKVQRLRAADLLVTALRRAARRVM